MNANDVICDRLARFEEENGVVIVHASCVGSHLWDTAAEKDGVSDYDVRFVYVHPISGYLTTGDKPKQSLDFREIIDGVDVDALGHDASHFVGMLAKGNAIAMETLLSKHQFRLHPVVFNSAVDRMTSLIRDWQHSRSFAFHYISWAEKTLTANILRGEYDEPVYVDHYIHAVRYALFAEHVVRTGRPWMGNLPHMMLCLANGMRDETLMSPECRQAVCGLIQRKWKAEQKDLMTDRIPTIDQFLLGELPELRRSAYGMPKAEGVSTAEADAVFHAVLGSVWDSWRPNTL